MFDFGVHTAAKATHPLLYKSAHLVHQNNTISGVWRPGYWSQSDLQGMFAQALFRVWWIKIISISHESISSDPGLWDRLPPTLQLPILRGWKWKREDSFPMWAVPPLWGAGALRVGYIFARGRYEILLNHRPNITTASRIRTGPSAPMSGHDNGEYLQTISTTRGSTWAI